MKTRLLSALMLFISLTLFSGCEDTAEESLIGTWRTTITEDETTFDQLLILRENKTYSMSIAVDETDAITLPYKNGTWKEVSGELCLITDGIETYAKYDLDGNNLTVKYSDGVLKYRRD